MSRPDGLPHLVEVRIDPQHHDHEPRSVVERISWEYLDTAYNLIREAAVKITIQALRETVEEAGGTFSGTDQELFAEAQAESPEDAPKNYLDLAPDDLLARQALAGAFEVLLTIALSDAQEGVAVGLQFRAEVDKLVGEGE